MNGVLYKNIIYLVDCVRDEDVYVNILIEIFYKMEFLVSKDVYFWV